MQIPGVPLAQFKSHIDDYIELTVTTFHYQPSGRKAVRGDLEVLATFVHSCGENAITGDIILEFLAHLRGERDNGSASINRKISSIRSYVRHLRFRQVEGAAELPIESLQRAREPYSGPVKVPTPAELHRLFEGVDRSTVLGVRDHLLFWLLYRLGLRLGEALAIDLADVDLANGTLQVYGKGRRERTLPLVDDVTDRIQEWLLLRQRLLRADREPALFLSKKGHRLSPRRAQEVFQAIVAEAGPLSVSRMTPHILRHAFASHALEGDADLIVLKAIMGHARIKSTHLYLHPSMRLLRQAVNDHLASEVLATIIETNPAMMPIHRHRSREGPAAA